MASGEATIPVGVITDFEAETEQLDPPSGPTLRRQRLSDLLDKIVALAEERTHVERMVAEIQKLHTQIERKKTVLLDEAS